MTTEYEFKDLVRSVDKLSQRVDEGFCYLGFGNARLEGRGAIELASEHIAESVNRLTSAVERLIEVIEEAA